jgi:Dioxygenases related to 2-nitropropane dioxygenase
VQQAHDRGIKVFHDITSIPFAGARYRSWRRWPDLHRRWGGGHSGTISHLALIRKVRSIFNGTIVMAGAISDGATIRAAEVLGAAWLISGPGSSPPGSRWRPTNTSA